MEKRTLFEHQEFALGVMAGTKALGIFYEMGTGKTAIALMYIYERLQRQSNLRVLVVCPPKLISNWQDDIEKMILFEGVTPLGIAALKKAITFVSYQKTYYTTQAMRSSSLSE